MPARAAYLDTLSVVIEQLLMEAAEECFSTIVFLPRLLDCARCTVRLSNRTRQNDGESDVEGDRRRKELGGV